MTEAPHPRRRPWLRPVLIGSAALIILLIGGIAALLTLPAGQAYIAARVLEIVNGAGNLTVSVGRTGGAWPNHIVLNDIRVRDQRGEWLTVRTLDLRMSLRSLLRGRIDAESLTVADVHALRLPESEPSREPSEPFDPAALRDTLRRVTLRRVDVAPIRLDPPVIGQAALLGLDGSLVQTNGVPELALSIERRDQPGAAALRLNGGPEALTAVLQGTIAPIAATADIRVGYGDAALNGVVRATCGTESALCYASDTATATRARADITLGGTAARPAATAVLSADGLKLAERPIKHVTGKISASMQDGQALAVNGTGTIAGVAAAVPEVAPVVDDVAAWSFAVRRSGTTTVVENARLQSGATEVVASATLTPDGIAPAVVTATVRNAARLGGMAKDTSTTRAELRVERALRDGTANARFEVRMSEVTPPPQMAHLLGREATIEGRLDADPSGLRVTDVRARSGGLNIKGETIWTGPAADLNHARTRFDVSAQVPTGAETTTPSTATISLNGPLETVAGRLEAQLAQVALGGATASNVTLAIDGKRNGKRFTVAADGSGAWRDQPLTLTARAEKGDGPEVTISALRLNSAAATVDGNLVYDTERRLGTGKIAAEAPKLEVIGALFGTDLSGAATMTATFSAPKATQRVAVDLQGKAVRHPAFAADRITARAVVDDALGDARIDARVDSTGGMLLERPLRAIAVRAAGPRRDLDVTLDVAGAARQPLAFALAAKIAMDDATVVTVSRFRASEGKLIATLQQPVRLTTSPATLSMEGLRLAVADGTIAGDLRVDRTKNRVAGAVQFASLSLNAFAAEVPTLSTPTNTTLGGRFTFSGPAVDTTVDGTLRADFDTGTGTRGEIAITANVGGGQAKLAGSATGFSPNPAELNAVVPMAVNLSEMRVAIDMEAPFRGSLTWNGEIGPLWRLVPLDDHVVSGVMTVDLSARGTLGAPQLQGGVRLGNGRYENIPQSMVLQNVNAGLTAQSGSSLTFALSADGRRSGKVTGEGSVQLDSMGAWIADIRADLDNLSAVHRDDLTANISGRIGYQGPVTSGTLTAKLDVRHAELRVDQIYAPTVPLLRSAEAARVEGRNPTATAESAAMPTAGPAEIALKVTVVIDDPMRVDGSGLTSWWRGRFTVGGTAAAPDVTGSMTVERGSFTFVGQTFTLDEGRLTFTGGGAIDPELAIVAVRETTEVTATVNITGRASQPKIELTSRPPLPQDEVLARLLFQKGSTELGPIESVQLASAAAELAGLSRGGLSGILQRTLGLDTVGIGGSSGSSLVVGEQIGRNLYVGVEQDLRGTGRQIVIEWRLTRGLSLRSATSDETGSDIGVSWRRDY